MKFTLLYNEEQNKADLIDQMILKPWTGYCLKNWLNDNSGNMLSPEIRVKRLLDRCGTLLLRDVPLDERNTLTSYKEMVAGSREIGFSDCPAGLAAMAESGTVCLEALSREDKQMYRQLIERLDGRLGSYHWNESKHRSTTRFDRLNCIQRMFQGCSLHGCSVDVDGVFVFEDRYYRLNEKLGKYAPKKTRYGDQYDMDRVIVIVVPNGDRHFADQDGYLIADEMVSIVER